MERRMAVQGSRQKDTRRSAAATRSTHVTATHDGVLGQQNNVAAVIQRAQSLSPAKLSAVDLLTLQRTVGNRAVGQLLRASAPQQHTNRPDTIQRFYAVKDEENSRKYPGATTGRIESLNLDWIDLPDPRNESEYPDTVKDTGWLARNLYKKKDAEVVSSEKAKEFEATIASDTVETPGKREKKRVAGLPASYEQSVLVGWLLDKDTRLEANGSMLDEIGSLYLTLKPGSKSRKGEKSRFWKGLYELQQQAALLGPEYKVLRENLNAFRGRLNNGKERRKFFRELASGDGPGKWLDDFNRVSNTIGEIKSTFNQFKIEFRSDIAQKITALSNVEARELQASVPPRVVSPAQSRGPVYPTGADWTEYSVYQVKLKIANRDDRGQPRFVFDGWIQNRTNSRYKLAGWGNPTWVIHVHRGASGGISQLESNPGHVKPVADEHRTGEYPALSKKDIEWLGIPTTQS
jgi:hypothetical protein